jgi:putative peptidoglycan lipid II flippase
MTTLARAAIIISVGNFASILVNAAKAIVVAMYFGTGNALDSYFIAYIPFLILNGILVASMQYSIIPMLVEISERGEKEQESRLFGSFFSLSLVLFLSLSVLLFGFSDSFVRLLAPGFGIEKSRFTAHLLEIISPTIFISGASEIINSRFHSEKKFWPPILANITNIVVSFAYLLVFYRQGIRALAFGMVLGSCAQFGVSALSARRESMRIELGVRFSTAELSMVFRNLVPMFLSILFANINLAVDQMMASSLPGGSISSLNYANNIIGIIQQVSVYSIGSAILPFLSQQVASGNLGDLKTTFRLGIRMMVFIMLPVTIYILILGEPAIALFFQRGAFEHQSTVGVANALKAFSLGLIALSLGILGVRILTAFQLTRSLAYISFGNVFVNVTLNWILMKYYGYIGIALSTSLSYMISCLLISFVTRRTIGGFDLREVLKPVGRITIWSIVSGLVSAVYFIVPWGSYEYPAVLLAGGFGVIVYIILALNGRSEELKLILENLKVRKDVYPVA